MDRSMSIETDRLVMAPYNDPNFVKIRESSILQEHRVMFRNAQGKLLKKQPILYGFTNTTFVKRKLTKSNQVVQVVAMDTEYADVLVPYTKVQLSNRRVSNKQCGHFQRVRVDSLSPTNLTTCFLFNNQLKYI